MHRFFFAALACVIAAAPARAQETPDWIVGAWRSCAGGEVREVWTGAGAGLLVGVNLTRTAAAPQFEFLRIGPGKSGVSFFGGPQGIPPTEFPMIAHEGRRAVFENPTHDFPQRVIYARAGRDLTARIEGTIDGAARHMEWRFRPSTLTGHCPVR